MELVSIIVPVYKAEKKIERCLLSLISQTYKKIEIILVNDGTPDRAFEICKEYTKKDSRIVLIEKEKNTGRSDTRNLGIKRAKGTFLMFVDSDDFVAENYVERLLEISNHGQYWGVCSFYYFEKPVTIENYRKLKGNVILKYYSNNQINEIMDMLLFNSPCNKLYHRDIIEHRNIQFDMKLNLGEDLKFNLEYWRCWNGELCVSTEQLYAYDLTAPDSFEYELFDCFVSMWGDFMCLTASPKNKIDQSCVDKIYVRIFDELVRAVLHDYSLKNGSWFCRYRKARKNISNKLFGVLLTCRKINFIKRILVRYKLINIYCLIYYFNSHFMHCNRKKEIGK